MAHWPRLRCFSADLRPRNLEHKEASECKAGETMPPANNHDEIADLSSTATRGRRCGGRAKHQRDHTMRNDD